MKKTYSTAEVASAIGVDKSTLLRWLYAGKIPEPRMQTLGGVSLRVWSEQDMQRAKNHREEHYRKRVRL